MLLEASKHVVCCLIVWALLLKGASSEGIGEQLMWSQGQQLSDEFEIRDGEAEDFLFKGGQVLLGDEQMLIELLDKQLQVQVVAPGKELTRMMNTVSTKTRAMFLSNFQHYFTKLQIGSTSRPMLMAYLGLEMASEEQIASWYKPIRRRSRAKIVANCESLIGQSSELKSQLSDEQRIELMAEAKKQIGDEQQHDQRQQKFAFAYLIQQHNVNLFMLESYLLLCAKLEPLELRSQLERASALFL